MTKEMKRGGSRLLRVMIAVLVSIAFFAHMGLSLNVQAAEDEMPVLFWQPSAPSVTVPGGSDQVTLSFTMTGDASVPPYLIGVSFGLAHPDTKWTLVGTEGLDDFAPTAVQYLAGIGYMITGNQYAPVQLGHVVTVTLLVPELPEGVESFDLKVIGTFEVDFEDRPFIRIPQPGHPSVSVPPVVIVRCECVDYCEDCEECDVCGNCECDVCVCVYCEECGECLECGNCDCEECDCEYVCPDCDECLACGDCDCCDCECPGCCDCKPCPGCCDCEPCDGCCDCDCECPVICDCDCCDCEPCDCDCCDCEPCDCDCCDCDDNGKAPQTGDNANHVGLLMSLIMSAGAALLTVKHLRKRGRL